MQVKDVLNRFGVQLAQEAQSPSVLDRHVAGAHVLEVPHPLRYVPPEWILLSTAMRLFRKPSAQREFIAELSEGGIAALGFGVGVTFDRPPPALLEEAQERDFPVFVVPEEMPFRDIIRFVDAQRLGDDLHSLHRSILISDRLHEAITEDDPEAALASRLGHMLRCKISLFDAFGGVVTSTDRSSSHRVWKQLSSMPSVHSDDGVIRRPPLTYIPVEVDGVVVRWLVASTTGHSLEELAVERGVRDAAVLLTTFHRMQRARHRALSRERSELLLAAIDPPPDVSFVPVASRTVTSRSQELSVDLHAPSRIVVMSPPTDATGTVEPISTAASRVEAHLARTRTRALVAQTVGQIVIRVGTGVNPSSLFEIDELSDWTAGSGRIVDSPHLLRRSYLDAKLAASEAMLREPGTLIDHHDIDLVNWLISQTDEEDVDARAMAVLAPLEGHPELLATLVTYFEIGMNTSATARRMHLHKNSLRYRLLRIEELLDRDLHHSVDVAVITTALAIKDRSSGRSGQRTD